MLAPHLRGARAASHAAPRRRCSPTGSCCRDPGRLADQRALVQAVLDRGARATPLTPPTMPRPIIVPKAAVILELVGRTAVHRRPQAIRGGLCLAQRLTVRSCLLLVEALVLAGIGALAGLVFARWAGPMLVAQLSTSVTRVTLDLSLDWRVLAFTVAVTAATAVLFGTAPAFRARRIAPIDALKEQGRGALGDGRTGLSGSLVVAQVALSMVLIVAAGLLVGTFERLATLPLGFDSDRVLIVNVDVSRAPIDPANRIPFFHQLVAAVAAVPGVARAGGSMNTPVGGSASLAFLDLPGAPPAQPEPGPVPFWNSRMALLNRDHAGMARHLRDGDPCRARYPRQGCAGSASGRAGQRRLCAQVPARPEPDRRNRYFCRGSAQDYRRSRERRGVLVCA